MAITFSIAPNPHWVIIDNFSKLPPGAAIYTFSSLNPSQFKPAFQDAGGTVPYGQPIVGFGNGTMPPIFWQFDDAQPDDLYYIQVWDKVQGPNSTAVMLWDFSGLTGGGSGGGGGTITTNLDLENLVVNGEFYRNIGTQTGGPSIPTFITLAPSNNSALGGYENSVGNDGPPAPDIIFAKSNTSAVDTLSFNNFNPIGLNDLGGVQPTPQQFANYTCSAGSTETYKFVQFPILKGLQNLSGQTVSVQMFNRFISGDTNILLSIRQFFGNGAGASPDVITNLGSLNLTAATWTKTTFTSVVVPSIAGKTLGGCGNDALFLQLRFPSGVAINLDFILPAMYLGITTSTVDFHTLDQVDGIVNAFRTGDIRTSLNAFQPYGWVIMNDGTIGDAASGSSTRANIDTFQLFNLIWTLFQANQTLAPMFTSGGVPIAYGPTPVADFTANRRISLTLAAGRVLAAVSGSHLIGTSGGADTHTNTIAEMANHNHPGSVGGQSAVAGAGDGCVQGGAASSFGQTLQIAPQGGATPFDIRQPTAYYNLFIKL